MNIFNKKIISAVVTTIVMASSVSFANASQPAPAPISILDTLGTEASPFSLGDLSNIVYSTTSLQFADRIAYGKNANFDNQSPTTVGESILSIFNLPGLYLSSYTDGSTGNSATQTGNGNKSGSFTSNFAYQFLAVHFGNNELLFDFSSTGGIAAGQTFNISNLPNGLSNWRSYNIFPVNPSNDNPIGSPVPVPAAVWLFGSVLAGFAAVTRRKAKTA